MPTLYALDSIFQTKTIVEEIFGFSQPIRKIVLFFLRIKGASASRNKTFFSKRIDLFFTKGCQKIADETK